MEYEELRAIEREDAAADLASGEPLRVAQALLRTALHDPDREWSEHLVAPYLESPDVEVRKAAILAIAHIARIHERLDVARFVPLLRVLQRSPELRGAVEDALDDISTFVAAGG
jgi:hypothetical protein